MEAQEFNEILREKTRMAERIIKSFLPEEEGYQKTVIEAMNYSMNAGGKRLRPLLMEETFLFCGGREEDMPLLEPFMAAIEMIHTYSLVHDDLPAMDNDEYRRGKKTTWSVYGEALGILAGDGLLNLAFETALQSLEFCSGGAREYLTTAPSPEYHLQRLTAALGILAGKAGIYGMIGGQTADIGGGAGGKPGEGAASVYPCPQDGGPDTGGHDDRRRDRRIGGGGAAGADREMRLQYRHRVPDPG